MADKIGIKKGAVQSHYYYKRHCEAERAHGNKDRMKDRTFRLFENIRDRFYLAGHGRTTIFKGFTCEELAYAVGFGGRWQDFCKSMADLVRMGEVELIYEDEELVQQSRSEQLAKIGKALAADRDDDEPKFITQTVEYDPDEYFDSDPESGAAETTPADPCNATLRIQDDPVNNPLGLRRTTAVTVKLPCVSALITRSRKDYRS